MRRLPPLALAAAVLLWFVRVMLANPAPRGLGSSDLYEYHYFVSQYVFGAFARGELPTWNPFQLGGLPTLGTLEVGAFYPPNLVHLVFPTWAAMASVSVFHLLLAAFGTWAFVRRAGIGTAGALVAACLFALRGTFPNFAISPNLFAAAAWLPLGALGVLALVERPRARAVAIVAAAAAASLLGGHPQATLYLVYAWTSLLIVWTMRTPAARARWPATATLYAAALGLGVAVALVQLLPTAELTRLGARPAASVAATQLQPMGAFTTAVKQLFVWPLHGSWLSFGIVALALAGAAMAAARHTALAAWALAVAVLSALVALGPLTPVFALYDWLPLAGWFRIPERIALLTDFAFAVLAAIGVDHLTTSRGRDARPALVRAALVLPAAAVAYLAWKQGGPGMAAALAVLVAAVSLARRPHGARPRLAVAALVAAVALEIAAQPRMPVSFPYGPGRVARVSAHEGALRAVAAAAGHDRVWLSGAPFDPALARKQATRHRMRGFDDYAPLSLRRQSEYFTFLARGVAETDEPLGAFMGFVRDPPPAERRRLVDLAAVRYFVADDWLDARPDLLRFLAEAGWRRVDIGAPLRVFENPHVLPRAFTVHHTRPAPPVDELLGLMADPAFDPLATSFVEDPVDLLPASAAGARGTAAAFVEDGERAVELDVKLEAPGLVVLADAWFPGWTATVDGRAATIVRTNHLFRGVIAPAGRHRVRFEYHPDRVAWGAAGTVIGLVVLGVLVWPQRRERPQRTIDAVRPESLRDRMGG